MRYFIKIKTTLRAFSLIEMVVSMSIIMVMVLTLYGNYPAVKKYVSYTTAINDFSSQIKEIQIYGASRGGDTVRGDGIYIATSTPFNYFLFSDIITSSSSATGIGISNLRWDGSALEPTSTKSFLNTTRIFRICYDNTSVGGAETNAYTCNISNLMIVFSRPKLNANMFYVNSSGATTSVMQACLEFDQVGVSTSTQLRSLVIKSPGQIIIQRTKCAP
jgi:type II secretory pathway pseudopilin PulG